MMNPSDMDAGKIRVSTETLKAQATAILTEALQATGARAVVVKVTTRPEHATVVVLLQSTARPTDSQKRFEFTEEELVEHAEAAAERARKFVRQL